MLKCFILEAKPLPVFFVVVAVSEHGNLGHFPSKYSFRFFCGYTKPELLSGGGNGKFLRWYAVHYTAFETFWALWVSFSFFREFFILQGAREEGKQWDWGDIRTSFARNWLSKFYVVYPKQQQQEQYIKEGMIQG